MNEINDHLPLSSDFNKERLEYLKKYFPDLFSNEGNLDIKELEKIISPERIDEIERYEFKWFGKSNAKRNAFTPSSATLVYDENRSVNPSLSDNLIIEGENLEVLKLLSKSYREKVKCIYIDPPYNTGKDFVYSDKYTQEKKAYWEDTGVIESGVKIDTNVESDGRFHSNWLNMMYSRLLIARNLLKDDGVILISIDNIEVSHLRELCNEVFGEDNFLSILVWKSGRTAASHFTNEHEYILAYAKNKAELPLFKFEGNEDISDRAIKRETEKNPISQIKFPKGMDFECDDTIFPSEFGNGEQVKVIEGQFEAKNGKLENDVILEAAWTMKDMIEDWIDGYDVIDQKGQKVKRFFFKKNGVLQYEKEKGTIHPKSIITDYSTKNGTNALKELFGEAYLDFPKPPGLLKHLFRTITDDEDLVLDFFSGSGTAGQAIFEINNECNDSNRRFILVQLPEATKEKSNAYKAGYKKISDITIERNKRVIEKVIKAKKEKQPELFDNGDQGELMGLGFKVFKLVKSNFPRVDFTPDPDKSEKENVEMLKKYISAKEAQLVTAFNKDDLITEILLKNGFTLNYKLTLQGNFTKNEIFLVVDGDKKALISLDISLDMATVEYFKTNTDLKFICLERALDTTKKWNLKQYLGDNLIAF